MGLIHSWILDDLIKVVKVIGELFDYREDARRDPRATRTNHMIPVHSSMAPTFAWRTTVSRRIERPHNRGLGAT